MENINTQYFTGTAPMPSAESEFKDKIVSGKHSGQSLSDRSIFV